MLEGYTGVRTIMPDHKKNNDMPAAIISALRKNGYKAYIVGGAVRDMLLERIPSDVDILTNASHDRVMAVFSKEKVRQVGRTFPICIVNGIEVSSGRSGLADEDFPMADLSCRDFTINAMAFDPLSGTVMDPFNGKRDLEHQIIRFVRKPEDRIMEDPVRMIRACRFSAGLRARLSDSALKAVSALAPMMDTTVPGERIRAEIIKAMAMEKPSGFFELLEQTGLLSRILPCLGRCVGLDGGPFHGETVFEHCMLAGNDLPPGRPLLRLAGYLHDTGKFDARSIKDGRITFRGHEDHTAALEQDLDRLKFSNRDKAYILSLVRAHMRPLTVKTTPKAVRRLLSLLDSLGLSYRDFMRMRIADKKGNLAKSPYTFSDIRLRLKKINREISALAAFTLNDLAVTGKEIMEILNLEPGPEVGRIKEILFEKVLDEPALNTREKLVTMVMSLKKDGDNNLPIRNGSEHENAQ